MLIEGARDHRADPPRALAAYDSPCLPAWQSDQKSGVGAEALDCLKSSDTLSPRSRPPTMGRDPFAAGTSKRRWLS
jgi:hypothetical protein